jgi:hypothetical protein
MKRIVAAAALAASFGLPAFGQGVEIVCDDFLAMDNAQQMATLAEIEGQAAEMDLGPDFSAAAIHEKLTADCASRPTMLIVDVIKEGM